MGAVVVHGRVGIVMRAEDQTQTKKMNMGTSIWML